MIHFDHLDSVGFRTLIRVHSRPFAVFPPLSGLTEFALIQTLHTLAPK
jgi:hypothetical protein